MMPGKGIKTAGQSGAFRGTGRQSKPVPWVTGIALALILILASPTFMSAPLAGTNKLFKDLQLESPFDALLSVDPEFMRQGGARLLELDSDGLALLGIAKVILREDDRRPESELRRIGEIQARAAVLELTGEVEIQTARGTKVSYSSREKILLTDFFQCTTTEVRDKIEQLPVIGTWRSADGETFYVAVGWIISTGSKATSAPDQVIDADAPRIDGQEPFVSILQNSPVLRNSGGARAFYLPDGRLALISVGVTRIGTSPDNSRKLARLKAIRALLGSRSGVTITSIQILIDRETLLNDNQGERIITLSDFLAIQEEKVSGSVTALPVVAEWRDQEGKTLYVAIGTVGR